MLGHFARTAWLTRALPLGLSSALLLPTLVGCGGRESPAAYPASAYQAGAYPAQPYPSSPPPSPPAPPPSGIFSTAGAAVGADAVLADATTAESSPTPASMPTSSFTPTGTGTVPAATNGATSQAVTRDLVIYSARLTMAVYQVDQALVAVEKIAAESGGYLDQKRDREITVRIPRARFHAALGAIDAIGDVLHREIAAQDVTDEHVDLEIRIRNARAMQKRLVDLLGKASVKDALAIEKELHRVTEDLERLEGKMKLLTDKIAFSTITVAFEPRGSTIQATRVKLPFAWLTSLNLPSLLSLTEDK